MTAITSEAEQPAAGFSMLFSTVALSIVVTIIYSIIKTPLLQNQETTILPDIELRVIDNEFYVSSSHRPVSIATVS